MVAWWFVPVSILILAARILGQPSTEGFISIDCGSNDSGYTDPATGLTYSSDNGFIDGGFNYKININASTQLSTLRSFPNGTRNCYSFTTFEPDTKLLIRAAFFYGNYDGQNSVKSSDGLSFDLWLGTKFWKTMNLTEIDNVFTEVITVTATKYLWVCLVNTGHGTPFISSLELRPLDSNLYPAATESQPLILFRRLDYGSANRTRYPDDPYDRFWLPPTSNCLTPITTDKTIRKQPGDLFQVPQSVMQTAVIPCNSKDTIAISWPAAICGTDICYEYHFFMHFADFQQAFKREFKTCINQVFVDESLPESHPEYLLEGHIFSVKPYSQVEYNITLQKTSDSLLPPLINAMEIYQVTAKSEVATNSSDVDVLMSIKDQYQVKKNWMGDPCAPQENAWDGVSCNNYSNSGTPRVKSLTLSSSGLNGGIPSSLANLSEISSLDLSVNYLTGTIPDFLADLPFLKFLNLSGNQLTGSVPDALTSKYREGSLRLSVDGNPNLCTNPLFCEPEKKKKKKKKKKNQITLICSLTLVAVLVLVAVLLPAWVIRRRKSQGSTLCTSMTFSEGWPPVNSKLKRFSYTEIQKMTNKHKQRLGSGGFGSVYSGIWNGRNVAVKMINASKGNAIKVFRREAKVMFRTDHENVVKLVGYCKEGDNLALVSECMAEGDLLRKLKDGARDNGLLSWEQRLRIASGAAKGLKYLHDSDIIHRDVKSSNILLDEHLNAKVADFGLSKICNLVTATTSVEGATPAYVAPEMDGLKGQTKKTDVFSFGVVLLELITGKPPLIGEEELRISDWVKEKPLNVIVDSRLDGVYDVESVEKVKTLADMCMEPDPNKRPDMSTVVTQLMPYETPSTGRAGSLVFDIIDKASSSTGP